MHIHIYMFASIRPPFTYARLSYTSLPSILYWSNIPLVLLLLSYIMKVSKKPSHKLSYFYHIILLFMWLIKIFNCAIVYQYRKYRVKWRICCGKLYILALHLLFQMVELLCSGSQSCVLSLEWFEQFCRCEREVFLSVRYTCVGRYNVIYVFN